MTEPPPHLELSRYCIPFSPMRGRLEEAAVALVSTAGVHLRSDTPFDPEGDNGYRMIPGTANGRELTYSDRHYDHGCVDKDINCVFPIDRLRELAHERRIGSVADKHFSMGYTQQLRAVREQILPRLVKELADSRPDAVLLTGG